MRSALCSSAISSGVATSGVYTRPEKYGKRAGSPWMCVWQSQAPGGTSKPTGVAGWEALARPARARRSNPAASVPATNRRRVSMGSSIRSAFPGLCPGISCDQRQFQRPAGDHFVLVEQAPACGVVLFIFFLQALETTIAPGRARVKRKDGVAGEHEAAAQRADRRVARGPVGRARAVRERLDLGAVVGEPRRIAAQAQHRLEAPAGRLMLDRGFAGGGGSAPARRARIPLPPPSP